jgi:histidine triad (HIT) family protein
MVFNEQYGTTKGVTAMKKDDCIFCKLANGDIPTNSIYEDEDFKVILDMGPATKGHALILPKDHADNLFELPDETAGKAMILAKKLAKHMMEVLDCDGLNVVQNNGEAAGQTVMHYHLHLIPRYKDDNQHILWNPTKPSTEELQETCRKLKQ